MGKAHKAVMVDAPSLANLDFDLEPNQIEDDLSRSKCKYCGCTDDRACPGGCRWVKPNVCSSCFKKGVRE
jgi:hypothetical protein